MYCWTRDWPNFLDRRQRFIGNISASYEGRDRQKISSIDLTCALRYYAARLSFHLLSRFHGVITAVIVTRILPVVSSKCFTGPSENLIRFGVNYPRIPVEATDIKPTVFFLCKTDVIAFKWFNMRWTPPVTCWAHKDARFVIIFSIVWGLTGNYFIIFWNSPF